MYCSSIKYQVIHVICSQIECPEHVVAIHFARERVLAVDAAVGAFVAFFFLIPLIANLLSDH